MRRTATIAALAGALALATLAPAVAAGPTGTITGTVGENVSTTDGYDGRHLRFVGDPAPDGYASWYQWGSPYILTESPEDAPVTMAGTINVDGMTAAGQVAVIGLHDADALRAGDRGEKAEVGIYVAYDGANYTVGVTDGEDPDHKGEFVQRFTRIAEADLADGVLNVEFIADGTADPTHCASDPDDVSTADGCMTLTVNGQTITDSYGTIVPTDIVIDTELGSGAHPGWYSAYGSGDGPNVGVTFNLDISPIVLSAPQSADECRDGGYETWDYKNQGTCISSVQANENAGK